MKIIFLDFDGVLNSSAYLQRMGPKSWGTLDQTAVERLNKLIAKTNAQVVISSSWRYGHTVDQLRFILREAGFAGRVIDMTPMDGETVGGIRLGATGIRGFEIQAWLNRNKEVGVTEFVILDDCSILTDTSMAPHLMERFVQTSMATGLLDTHVEEAARKLGC